MENCPIFLELGINVVLTANCYGDHVHKENCVQVRLVPDRLVVLMDIAADVPCHRTYCDRKAVRIVQ